MVYARQMNPAYQESPLFIFDEWPESMILYGNRDYRSHTIPVFDCLIDNYEACMTEINNFQNGYRWYKNITEIITDYLPPVHKDKYSTKEVHTWKLLLEEWEKAWDRKSRINEDDCIVEALGLMTGQKWDYSEIHGSCQGDWQTIYFVVDEWDRESRNAFEIEYFNMGSEWMIHDGNDTPEQPEDISGITYYCTAWNEDGIRKQLADIAGCKPEEVKAWAWNGETWMPKYKEIV